MIPLEKASALLPAAGRGERFGRPTNKVYAEIAGKPILAHTLSVFEKCKAVEEIIIVVGKDEIEAAGELVGRFGYSKVSKIVEGGAQRQDSVARGLEQVSHDIVAIHDAARPMITCDIIEASIAEAARSGACIAAVPVIDTIKSASPSGVVSATIDRSNLYAVQTPQTFRTEIIREAFQRAFSEGYYATDDAALVERMGRKVSIVRSSYDNIKITTQSDLEVASRKLGGGETRTGMGLDVHRFSDERKLILGGVDIPFDKGLLGHSDADVLLHAISDALLGAASLGDIGQHFPDTDPQYKGASSIKLLKHVAALLFKESWNVINVDAVVACQRPKLAPHIPQMRKNIADCLDSAPERISVKATTTEGLGYIGREEGISCYAIATIRRV